VTTGTLEEVQWEVLPHPAYIPGVSPSDFHLFSPIKEALGEKIFKSDDKFKLFVHRWLDE
jgi:hypothetical protein